MLTHEEILEIGKIMSDFFKQMITLDTGIIVLIIAIVEKVFTTETVFKNKFKKYLLIFSILSFLFSLIFALTALLDIANRLTNLLQGVSENQFVSPVSFNLTIYTFLIGIAIFIILAIISIFSSNKPDQQVRTKELKR